MKYKLKIAMAGPTVSHSVGDMIEISEDQLQGYIDADMIVVPESTIKKVEKPKKKTAKPKKGKAKKTKV